MTIAQGAFLLSFAIVLIAPHIYFELKWKMEDAARDRIRNAPGYKR